MVEPHATTLPAPDHAARRDRLRAAIVRASEGTPVGDPGRSIEGTGESADEGPAGVDLLLVTDPVNVRYLAGFRGSNGQVLVGRRSDDDRLVTDSRYEGRAAQECADLPLVLSRDPIGEALAVARGGRLGVEAAHLSWAVAEVAMRRAAAVDVEVVATDGLVEHLREVKDEAELARLATACSLTAEALLWLVAEVARPGRSERELATLLERRFVDLGADGVAFPSIVASGPNGAVPHHEPSTRELRSGELLTVDCGAVVDGYHADLTRTVAIGHVDGELREVHDVVRTAQERGRAAATPGVAARQIDVAAREVIVDAGYGERFVHGTGHGVGLEVHEAPAVASTSTATLAAGMALTVEPGIYLPGMGGVRIEDTIVVTADGAPRTLADLPRDLAI